MKKIIIFICVYTGVTTLYAQDVNTKIREGNGFYKQQEYDKALGAYHEALKTEPDNTTAKFNAATSLVRQAKNDEAVRYFEEVIMNSNDADLKGKAYYNIGVILTNQQRLEESIEAYKNALRYNPNDTEARENLQKALQELKKKTPPPPKENKNKKQQQQKKQQEQPKMNRQEAEQRLKLLEQKEKEVMQRFKKEKSGGGQQKDW
jgi:tetratricopeptide (TPR) repeat protein